MGVPVLIMGQSGNGKSTSLRNFAPDEIGIFNVASKALPFRKKMAAVVNKPTYSLITKTLTKNSLKRYAIDDAQYLMAFEQFSRASEAGYQKYTDIGLHFYQLVETVVNKTSEDTIVYFMQHTERSDDGRAADR